MKTINDTHQQFASFFKSEAIAPFAYLLSKRLHEGHICIYKKDADIYCKELPYQPPFVDITSKKLNAIVGTAGNNKPFILHKDRLYMHRYFTYETQILSAIAELLKTEQAERTEREKSLQKYKGLIASLQADYDLANNTEEEKIDWQLAAAIQGVLNNFTIITGGPGTGKTTTVAKILSLLYSINPNCKVALAAPTGKAAMRMAESLKQTSLLLSKEIKENFSRLHPNTIHRLLKYIPNSIYFRHNKSNPLPYNVVIVDEASMIDVALFAKLLDAIGPNTRLILLGDKNQLASVEAGTMFGDLCKSIENSNAFTKETADLINHFIKDPERKIIPAFVNKNKHPLAQHIIELKKSHRFTGVGGIGKFSTAIIHNDVPTIYDFIHQPKDSSVIIDIEFKDNVFESFIKEYKAYLEEDNISLALQKLNNIRVLCAVREGPHGLYATNKAIEAYLYKHKLLEPKGEFYENRPIIITKNYPDLKLFNGDVGILRNDDNGNLRAWFEDSDKNIRAVMPGYISNAETVFAMTIHKSQGSEYKEVLVLLPQNNINQLLTRELLYTAVTRAKEKVIVQSTESIIMETAQASVKRASGIINRFEEI